MRKFSVFATTTALTLATLLSACAAGTKDPAGEGATETVTIFAAASLQSAFTDINNKVFKSEHPNVEVNLVFEGSSSLVEKISNGAPADVFASADEANMTKAGDSVSSPEVFTTNTLRLVVPKGNPANINGLADLSGKKLVVCAPQVPCGQVTGRVAEEFEVTFEPVSEEQSVTDVRTKVASGEADAGFVYLTDAKLAADALDVVDIPGIENIGTEYFIAQVTDADNRKLAEQFISSVLSDEGQAILTDHGFGK